MQDDTAVALVKRWDQMKSIRSTMETEWREIREYVRPMTVEFNPRTTYATLRRSENVYDGTAVESLEQLASGLHSFLTNPTDRWFSLETTDPEVNKDHDSAIWLDQVSDIIYSVYSWEDVNLNPSLHEVYLDIGAFGLGVIMQEEDPRSLINFRSYPVGDVWVSENNKGQIDTVFRLVMWTNRQIMQEFPDVELPTSIRDCKDESKQFEILHCVFPREKWNPAKLNAGNMPFASIWICTEPKVTLRESGYRELPYHAPRWTKLAGEIYGRSPAHKCLPDIRMLQSMERTLLKAGAKATDPPLMVPDDGFLLPIRTTPGSLIFKEPGAEPIVPLEHRGQLPWAFEHTEQKRNFIRQCFFIDWLRMEKQKIEMTAFEVSDRREEKLRLLAPILGRQQSELLSPLIARTYAILDRRGHIPPAPPALQNKRIRVVYISPAAKAQTGIKAIGLARFIQEILPMMDAFPEMRAGLDGNQLLRVMAEARGVPTVVLRSPEEVAERQKQEEMAQAATTAAGIAQPASQAVKNIAQAQAEMPVPAELLPS